MAKAPAPPPLDLDDVVIEETDLADIALDRYTEFLIYSNDRAISDVRDGLKPVQRRILVSFRDNGRDHTASYWKSAAHAGYTMGRYHPHGDQAIYMAAVNMAQDFSFRYPLIDFKGNKGSISGDGPGAYRYCVSGDTRVATPSGTVRIDSLVPTAEPDSDNDLDIEVLDRLGRPVRASKLFHSGDHPTLRLRTSLGHELTGTHNHPVLCMTQEMGVPRINWKLLGDIASGDHVLLLRSVSDHEGKLSERDRQTALVVSKRAQKAVPELVWRSSALFKRAFLRSLFTGYGSCVSHPRSSINISYSTRSEQLAKDVQLLLLESGIISRIYDMTTGEFKVVICNRREARLFYERIGFHGPKQKKLEDILAVIPLRSRAFSADSAPFVSAYIRSASASVGANRKWLSKHNIDRIERWENEGDEILARIASSEVRDNVGPLMSGAYFYAEVKSVEDAGIQPVYSIRVDTDDHSFITNGFVSHNTEMRLSAIGDEMLRDLYDRDGQTVAWGRNYNNDADEPIYVPSRFPELFCNGNVGIGTGRASTFLPHNLREVVDALLAYVDNPDIEAKDFARYIKGPDFPGGAIIMGNEGFKEMLGTGRGRVIVRAKMMVEERGRDTAIVVTEIPWQKNLGDLVRQIMEAAARDQKTGKAKIEGIADVVDHSGKDWRTETALVVTLRKDANAKVVANQLYKYTGLQDSFSYNQEVYVDGYPQLLNFKQVVEHYIAHQFDVLTRRTTYRRRKAAERLEVQEAYIMAHSHADELVALARRSTDRAALEAGIPKLIKNATVRQCETIAGMALYRFSKLDTTAIRERIKELKVEIAEYDRLLGSPDAMRNLLKDELRDVRTRYGDERRTQIDLTGSGDIKSAEELIPDDPAWITITEAGYIKRLPINTYRIQKRGGQGVIGAALKEDDRIMQLTACRLHDTLLMVTNQGRVFRLRAYELPEAGRTDRGQSLKTLIQLAGSERVMRVLPLRKFEGYLTLVTRSGRVKRGEMAEYASINAAGLLTLNTIDDDELVAAMVSSGKDHMLITTSRGQVIRFKEEDVRATGRSQGVAGIDTQGASVVAASIIAPNDRRDLLTVSSLGAGKRTRLTEYPVKSRGGKGVIGMALPPAKAGRVASVAVALVVDDESVVLLSSSAGKTALFEGGQIRRAGRQTQGVIVLNLSKSAKLDETVVAGTAADLA